MPIAGPPTAATMGFPSAGKTSKNFHVGETAPCGGRCRKALKSLPAAKRAGRPWSRIARTCGSASAAARAAASWPYISALSAFFFSGRAISTKPMRFSTFERIKSFLREPVVLHLLAQRELGELAGGRVRQLGHEHHVVGHPPLGDLAFIEAQHLVPGYFLPRLFHCHHDRPLVPFRMLDADHRGFRNGRMRDRDLLQVDRADQLAPGLDSVLCAV